MFAFIAALPGIIFDNPVLGLPLLAVAVIGFVTALGLVGSSRP